MADIKYLIKTQGPLLLPFFVSLVLYFTYVRDPVGAPTTTILKCAPVVSLALYVLLKCCTISVGIKYSQRILFGLIFSYGGDVLLNVDLFPHGMGSFAIAQICYITAFGFKPLKLLIGLPLYLVGGALVAIVFKDLDRVLAVGLPVYVFLLLTMCWRCIARASGNPNYLSILCAVGSVFFVISDALIGIDMFLVKVPYARLWIMSTYYSAQFAIALSTASDCLKRNLPRGIRQRSQMK